MSSLRSAISGLILKGFDALNTILGVNVRFFAKNATIVTFGYGISVLRGIVTGYLVARLFPRELYGQYQFILSVVGTVGVASLPGLVSSTSRAIARGEKGIILPVAHLQLAISLIGAGLLLAIIPFLPAERATLWPLFLLAAILFPMGQTATGIFSAATIGNSRFDISLKANITWSVLMVIATTCILVFHPSPALLYTASAGLPALAYLWFSRYLLPKNEPSSSIREIVRYGIQLTLVSLPTSLSWYIDKLMISALFGLNQLAVFSVGILIPEQVKTWAKELMPVSFAVQARGNDTIERRKKLMSAVGRATVIMGVGIAIYMVCAPYIYALLFPNYPEAAFLSQLSALTLLVQPAALLTQYLEAQAMIKELRQSQWISAVIFVISLVTLIPLFGLPGAVIARGMLRLSYALCAFVLLLRIQPATTSPGTQT